MASTEFQGSICAIRLHTIAAVLALGLVFLPIIATQAGQAQTFTVLHAFGGADGQLPYGPVILDQSGNLYGTTSQGGDGYGVVFKLDSAGNETVLHIFEGGDGALPGAGLLRDASGNLYGTTYEGGDLGLGVVFKLDSAGNETVLHSFIAQDRDGEFPEGALVGDRSGNLYGTTLQGGKHGLGTVFKLNTKSGREQTLYNFGGKDGENPEASLLRDPMGNLYGTVTDGGTGHAGAIFKVDTAGTEALVYSFTGGSDGRTPSADLIHDAAGNFYGTTHNGGNFSCYFLGCGVVFKLDSAGALTPLYEFTGDLDGGYPSAGVVRDAAGNLFGTAYSTVFKIDSANNFTVLHALSGADGSGSLPSVVRDSVGNLYGAAPYGGDYGGTCTAGCGTVFKISFP